MLIEFSITKQRRTFGKGLWEWEEMGFEFTTTSIQTICDEYCSQVDLTLANGSRTNLFCLSKTHIIPDIIFALPRLNVHHRFQKRCLF